MTVGDRYNAIEGVFDLGDRLDFFLYDGIGSTDGSRILFVPFLSSLDGHDSPSGVRFRNARLHEIGGWKLRTGNRHFPMVLFQDQLLRQLHLLKLALALVVSDSFPPLLLGNAMYMSIMS